VKSSYNKYVKVPCKKNVTGLVIAQEMLKKHNITNVKIVESPGFLSDHYNPSTRTIGLSRDIYHGTSLASLSISAHEVGHAIQHASKYIPVVLRGRLVPVTTLCSRSAPFIFMAGMLFAETSGIVMDIGIWLFVGVLFFHLVTLPVEFNASKRAMDDLKDGFLVDSTEIAGCQKMLKAAALTYVASTIMVIAQLLRMILIRNSRR
jgi:hypothetical protein